jgi:PAS domain S-box-containing protein
MRLPLLQASRWLKAWRGQGGVVWAIAAGSFVTLAALLGWTQQVLLQEREQAYAHVQDINSKLALSDEVRIRSLLSSLDKVLLVLRRDFAGHPTMTPRELMARLDELKLDRELSPNMSFSNADGTVVLTTANGSNELPKAINIADRAYFQKQKAATDDSVQVGQPVLSRISNKFVVPVSRRLISKDGSFSGIVTLTVDPNLFTEPFAQTSMGSQATRALMARDGYTLLRLNGGKIAYAGDSRKSQLYVELKKAPVGCYTAIASSDGIRRSVCYRAIDPYAIIILAGSSVANIDAIYGDTARKYIGAASLVAVLIAGSSALLILAIVRQRKVLASQQNFSRILELVPQSVVRMDARGDIAWVNRRTVDFAGASADEQAQGFDWVANAIHPEDLTRLTDFLQSAFQSRPSGKLFEYRKRRFDGVYMWFEAQVTPVQGQAGESEYFLVTSTDITERRQAESDARRLSALTAENQQVLEASRLKSEFLANMSHELRTPLNAVIGIADLLHAGKIKQDSPKYSRFLGHIGTSGRHLLQLINDVLDLSKVESGKFDFYPEPVDLAVLFKEVKDILQTAIVAKGVSLTMDIDPDLSDLVIDPSRLKQVLYNYLSNAIKFTASGGQVTLRAMAEGPEHFRIEVQDTGIGISDADLPRLFNDFQQLDSGYDKRHQGTGLGLALTRRLVQAQGGDVGVHSTVGVGSVFHLVLNRRHGHDTLRTQADMGGGMTERHAGRALTIEGGGTVLDVQEKRRLGSGQRGLPASETPA